MPAPNPPTAPALHMVRRALAKAFLFCWDRPRLYPLARRILVQHAELNMMLKLGRYPDQPQRRFNDFLHALKVGDELENPLRKRITDKLGGKAYVESRLGPEMTVPTLAVLEDSAAIAAYQPPAFPVAVKPTHSSGRILRITSDADWEAGQDTMIGWLKHDYFRGSLERNYAGLAKRVIVEPWLDESLRLEGSVHCRAGVPKVVSIIERYSKDRQSFSVDRKPLGVSLGFPTTNFQLTEWAFFTPLLQAAAQLSAELSYIRVDFYTDGRRLVFGELTSMPAAGVGTFYPATGEDIFSAEFFAPP